MRWVVYDWDGTLLAKRTDFVGAIWITILNANVVVHVSRFGSDHRVSIYFVRRKKLIQYGPIDKQVDPWTNVGVYNLPLSISKTDQSTYHY